MAMTAQMLTPWFMRDHMWTRRHMSDYLDHELDGPDHERVEHHVHRCPSCHRLLATLRRTLEGLSSLGKQPLPAEGVANSVIEHLRRSPP